jgi:hypothetical protein
MWKWLRLSQLKFYEEEKNCTINAPAHSEDAWYCLLARLHCGSNFLKASSGLLIRPNQPDLEDCTAEDVAYLVWREWMKESIAVPEGVSCDVFDWSNVY